LSEQIQVKRADKEDWKRILSLYSSLDEEDLEYRFFNLHRVCPDEAMQMADPRSHCTLLALVGEKLIGEATLECDGEVAMVVAKEWRHHGVATMLVDQLIQIAREKGVKTIRFFTLTGNLRMVEIGRAFGFRVLEHSSREEEWVLDL
jgi:GNAT superfamily N-acetyltransferase